jgi:hypothetical protein
VGAFLCLYAPLGESSGCNLTVFFTCLVAVASIGDWLSSCKLSLQPGPMQTWGRPRWAGGYNSCRNLDLGFWACHISPQPPPPICIHSALCWDVWTWRPIADSSKGIWLQRSNLLGSELVINKWPRYTWHAFLFIVHADQLCYYITFFF